MSLFFQIQLRRLLLLLCILPFAAALQAGLQAQQLSPDSEDVRFFEEGLTFYRNHDYATADSLFKKAETVPEAHLLRGNSLFMLGKFSKAKESLNRARALPMQDINEEAGYTLALIHFQKREYAPGLELLHELDEAANPALRERASGLMQDYCMFFTYDQRVEILNEISAPELMENLIRCGIELHSENDARQLFGYARRQQFSSDTIRELRELTDRKHEEPEPESETEESSPQPFFPDPDEQEEVEEKAEEISLEELFREKIKDYRLPEGFSYRVGLVLPQDDRESDGYEVSRAIYYGILQAVEEYNRTQSHTRIELVLLGDGIEEEEDIEDEENGDIVEEDDELFDAPPLPPDNDTDLEDPTEPEDEDERPDLKTRLLQMAEKKRPDILFGPLFSDDARIVARIADSLKIPVLAPLANSEDLSRGNPHFFHANPTFNERGRMMAEIAVNYLGHRNISIFADRTTLGAQDARAFRDRARELGAEIPYAFIEDLQARRFDLAEYTRFFAGDISLLDFDDEEEEEEFEENLRESDALYMPVSGSGAPAVIDLMMTQLLALRSDLRVIGSQEFGLTDINRQAARRLNIIYPEVFHRDSDNPGIQDFRDDYRTAYGQDPDMFSYIGYDNGRFLISAIELAVNPQFIREAMLSHSLFHGLGQRFSFNGRQVNGAMMLFGFEDGRFRIMELPEEPVYDLLAIRTNKLSALNLIEELSLNKDPEVIEETYFIYRDGQTDAPEGSLELFELLDKLEKKDVEQVFKQRKKLEKLQKSTD